MNNKNQENPNITIARELSQKFEFYFIALVFTILGLSVQTASIIKDYYQYVFEILAWCLLLVSGLSGLSRLEWLSIAYRHYGSAEVEKNNLNAMNQGLGGRTIINEEEREWTNEELHQAKLRLEQQKIKREIESNKVDRRTVIKYRIHKWAFVIGAISLVISRVILNLKKIF